MSSDIVTIANVSGFIAVGVIIVQFLVPTLLSVVLASILGKQNNGVTWSVAGRALQESYWPSLLRTESATWRGVRFGVLATTWAKTLGLLIIAVAGIVTPLGLYNDITSSGSVNAVFRYARDVGPFGFATPVRSNLGFMRRCGSGYPILCPGVDTAYTITRDGDSVSVDMPWGYSGDIPQDRYDYLQSGLSKNSNSISSIWDIEWRQYGYTNDNGPDAIFSKPKTNNGSNYIIGQYSNFDTTLLVDGPKVIEGLVVDTDSGAIGFRNHTLPDTSAIGTSWAEDLLFIEPEVVCVPNNLSITFAVKTHAYGQYDLADVKLIDRGGLADLDLNYQPYVNMDAQRDLDLTNRARIAAYLNNALTAVYYNVTDPDRTFMSSKRGDTYEVGSNRVTPLYIDVFRTTQQFSDYLMLPYQDPSENDILGTSPANAPNPNNITADNFYYIQEWCQWFNEYNPGNLSTVAVGCSMAYSLARPLDQPSNITQANVMLPNTKYSVDLYSCASAAKASIKTVDFKHNGTDFSGFSVLDITDKTYDSPEDVPWWGVENTDIAFIDGLPLWGLIDPTLPLPKNMSTYQNEVLYLPGFLSNVTGGSIWPLENMPGTDFHPQALSIINEIGVAQARDGDSGSQQNSFLQIFPAIDYSGKENAAMSRKWSALSNDATGIATIMKRVFSDTAANAVVGTKGLMGSRPPRQLSARSTSDNPSSTSNQQVVTTYANKVRYHYAFGIPAFLTLLMLIAVFLMAAVTLCLNHHPLDSLRGAVNRTSAGRIMAGVVYPHDCPPHAPRKEWLRSVGRRPISYEGNIPNGAGRGGEPVLLDSMKGTSASYMPVHQDFES